MALCPNTIGCTVLTGTVCVIHEIHLEGMSIVENALGIGGVILEFQSFQRGVILGLFRDNVDRRLSGPVGYRKIFPPFVRSYKYMYIC